MGAILITGASGYIGGRLAQHFVDAGVDIRVAGRHPQQLTDRWPGVDAVELDVMRPETIGPATDGVTTAYYLIHSMEEGGAPFEERDRTAATNFARAAAESGVERIVFLGGLGDDEDPDLSPHLASRHETGRLLAEHGPVVLELRAGMVMGAGSASFRMLEDLVRRLPVMVTTSSSPRDVHPGGDGAVLRGPWGAAARAARSGGVPARCARGLDGGSRSADGARRRGGPRGHGVGRSAARAGPLRLGRHRAPAFELMRA